MSLEDTFHIGLQAMSYFNQQKPEPEAPQIPPFPRFLSLWYNYYNTFIQ